MIKSTRLYIKQHSLTGLKYFGKTTRDPYTYNGSGKYWTKHIKKHGKDHIKTLWVSEPFNDKETLVEFATFMSEELDIVNSDIWANLQEENGIDGVIIGNIPWNKGKSGLYLTTLETRLKQSKVKIGKPCALEIKEKISKTQSIPLIINNIEYVSYTQASKVLNVSKSTIHRWVSNGKAKLKEHHG